MGLTDPGANRAVVKSLHLVFARGDDPAGRLLPVRDGRSGTLHALQYCRDGTFLEVCHFKSDGDASFDDVLAADDRVLDFETFDADGERVDGEVADAGRWCFARLEPGERVVELLGLVERFSLLLDTPFRFDAERVTVRVVGTAADISDAADALPEAVRTDMRVVRLTDYAPERDVLQSALTPRQREVLRAAVDVGYYADPRTATVADVADALGVAPSTVSEHLRKLEARVFARLT